jgi:hypothetical protein
MRLTLCVFLLCCFSGFAQEDSVFMKDIKMLDEISVSANAAIIFDEQNLYLIDFHVDSFGTYVLLKKNNFYLLSRLDLSFKMESTLLLPFKPIRLHRNCIQELYIISKDSVYEVTEATKEIDLYQPNTIPFYEEYFANCELETNNHLVYRSFFRSNQLINFSTLNRESSKKHPFYLAYDSTQVQVAAEWEQILRADGIDPVNEGQLDIALLLMQPEVFQRYTYFKHVIAKEDYIPMFKTDSSIHLFNFYIDSLISFSPANFEIDEKIPVNFQKIKGWKKQLLLDPAKNTYYTIFLNEGSLYISSLSSDNFSIVKSKKLPDAIMTKRLMVYNGFLYYDSKNTFESSFNELKRLRL